MIKQSLRGAAFSTILSIGSCNDCHVVCSIYRFESTIRGQFYGHTHFDQFNIFYDSGSPAGRPTAFEFIAPSLTTYSAVNPSYRMYTVDGDHAGTTWVHK
jgi:hypothetical protein